MASNSSDGDCLFKKEDLKFVQEPPEDIECGICFKVMLEDPHQTRCCGKLICGSCHGEIRRRGAACPYCRDQSYEAFLDRIMLRRIRSIQVYCINIEKRFKMWPPSPPLLQYPRPFYYHVHDVSRITYGTAVKPPRCRLHFGRNNLVSCNWKGELKDLAQHVNKGQRNGECHLVEVKCHTCHTSGHRCALDKHEYECYKRQYQCEYCGLNGIYFETIKHQNIACLKFPVRCPNKCEQTRTLLREEIAAHQQNECPLQEIKCDLSWAGCTDTLLRKDAMNHMSDKLQWHFSIMAIACGETKKQNEELRNEVKDLKKEIKELKNRGK